MNPATHQLLRTYGTAVTRELEQLFATPALELFGTPLSPQAQTAYERLQEYTLRPSKRVRGSLAAFTYDQATGGSLGSAGVQAGAAIELAQSYMLIIDDVMDRSETRRGRPTIHEIYREEGEDAHTADMLAVAVGLVAGHVLNIVMSSVAAEPARVVRAAGMLHRYLALTSCGQIDDIHQRIGSDVDEQAIIRKYTCKSSYYTFVSPMHVGAALGGVADESTLDDMKAFGVPAGIAFQLQDDVLGIFGDPAATGKSSADDIKEGKYTLLMHYALAHAGTHAAAELTAAVGNTTFTEDGVPRIREILEESGARAFVEARAAWYAQQAKTALAASTFWSDHAKTALASLVDFSITRGK